jgi:hypothetical protein
VVPVERTWAVGITTAPRREETLSRTLESYTRAGLPTPHVFADYGAPVPEGYPATRRDTRVGGWPNFFLGLSELVMRHPQADYYLMLQDDVVFCRNVGRYVERLLANPAAYAANDRRHHAPRGENPHAERGDYGGAARLAVLSFYCPSGYEQVRTGLRRVDKENGLIGALTFVFPRAAAHALVSGPFGLEYRTGKHGAGVRHIDGAIGRWAFRNGLGVYFQSTFIRRPWPSTSARPRRCTPASARPAGAGRPTSWGKTSTP